MQGGVIRRTGTARVEIADPAHLQGKYGTAVGMQRPFFSVSFATAGSSKSLHAIPEPPQSPSQLQSLKQWARSP